MLVFLHVLPIVVNASVATPTIFALRRKLNKERGRNELKNIREFFLKMIC